MVVGGFRAVQNDDRVDWTNPPKSSYCPAEELAPHLNNRAAPMKLGLPGHVAPGLSSYCIFALNYASPGGPEHEMTIKSSIARHLHANESKNIA